MTEFYQPYVIDPAQPPAAQPLSEVSGRIIAEPLFPEGRLPVLANVTVAGERLSSAKFRYTVSFDIMFPAPCFANGRLHAEVNVFFPRQVAIVNALLDEQGRMDGPFATFDLF